MMNAIHDPLKPTQVDPAEAAPQLRELIRRAGHDDAQFSDAALRDNCRRAAYDVLGSGRRVPVGYLPCVADDALDLLERAGELPR